MSCVDGGSAFPVMYASPTNDGFMSSDGMSLRDYFAAKVMQALNTNPHWDDEDFSAISVNAYRQADAMLAARRQP